MSKLPWVTADQVISAIQKIDFKFSRQTGSHKIFKNQKGKRVTVPYHTGKIIHPKVLLSIINDAELTVEEFIELL